jgi:hypothetical protein
MSINLESEEIFQESETKISVTAQNQAPAATMKLGGLFVAPRNKSIVPRANQGKF